MSFLFILYDFVFAFCLKGTTVYVWLVTVIDGKFHPTIDVWIWLRAFFYYPNTMAHFRGGSIKVKLRSVKNESLFSSFINFHNCKRWVGARLSGRLMRVFTRKLFFVVINADDSHDTQSMQWAFLLTNIFREQKYFLNPAAVVWPCTCWPRGAKFCLSLILVNFQYTRFPVPNQGGAEFEP